MPLSTLILASRSPRRQELLRRIGLPFEVVFQDVPERDDHALSGRELALFNAHRKASVVARRFPDRLVLGADTVVCLEAVNYGKPRDLAEAATMLEELQGRTHQVISGVALIQAAIGRKRLFTDITDVVFRPLTAAQISAYIAAVNPLDKAGAYAIQERGGEIVAAINGSHANVVGLPVERLVDELALWPGSEALHGRHQSL